MLKHLTEYLDSIVVRDPAPRSRWEVLLYPGVWAVGLFRVSAWFFEAGLFFLARLINHTARFLTGIDIHPGATIGKHLFIDHGFTVIGETALIGDNVTIYQCVTLGGTNPANGVGGKRHPTLEDDVIVGSGAQILGPIIIGKNARIGANAVVTEDVPEGVTMVGLKARSTSVPMDAWLKSFVPYGTPCHENGEPCSEPSVNLESELTKASLGTSSVDENRLAALEAQIEALRAEVQALKQPKA